jgi:hypothetical protein
MRLDGKDKVPQLTDVQTPEGETARQVDPAEIGQRKMLLPGDIQTAMET